MDKFNPFISLSWVRELSSIWINMVLKRTWLWISAELFFFPLYFQVKTSIVYQTWNWMAHGSLCFVGMKASWVVVPSQTKGESWNCNIFWDMLPCSPVEVKWCFTETYGLHIKGQRTIQASSEQEYSMPMYRLNVQYVTYVYITLNLIFSAVNFFVLCETFYPHG